MTLPESRRSTVYLTRIRRRSHLLRSSSEWLTNPCEAADCCDGLYQNCCVLTCVWQTPRVTTPALMEASDPSDYAGSAHCGRAQAMTHMPVRYA